LAECFSACGLAMRIHVCLFFVTKELFFKAENSFVIYIDSGRIFRGFAPAMPVK
jgi:hypothetical protein